MTDVALPEFNYIFAIAVLFAFLDAFNIGANDVANSFSSSVSSRALTYWQAMILAAIMEFLGAVLAGSRVSDTIRSKIIDVQSFENNPSVLMLTMACALVGSSIWLSIATSIGMPVSTTHSIVGAVIGAGIAANGSDHVEWGWDGFSQIVASWFIAPAINGALSATIFLITKYCILERKNSVAKALFFAPVIVFICFSILTMLVVWKGAPNLKLNDLSTGATVGSIFGVGAVATLLYLLFFHPYFTRKLVHEDWTLKFYHVLAGPTYYFKSTKSIGPKPDNVELVIDYYRGRRKETPVNLSDDENRAGEGSPLVVSQSSIISTSPQSADDIGYFDYVTPAERKLWRSMIFKPKYWIKLLWLLVTHGWRQDVISNQANAAGVLGQGVQDMYSKSKFYDTKTEHVFSLLQAFTACTMSFAHGSNDISNAAGPLSSVYNIWKTNTVGSKSEVPIWVLCFTAGSLVLGCWMFAYKLMSNLGNKMILQSPARGFAIELGAACTVVMATRLGIPVSTTQCAVGGTIFVGLCNMDVRGCNWKMVLWCYLGWFVTLPVAGLIAGLINGIILNAPRWGAMST
ncbi:hypothetical protein KL935_001129 [Ogataea polymorpha]|nr:hypothetical protein KL935_001129 [Ogataea polymorpha]